MFKKFAVFLIVLFIGSFAFLLFFWQDAPGKELYSQSPVTKVYRISQNLSGSWDRYSSLREAWVHTKQNQDSERDFISGLLQSNRIILPSNQGFRVAVKQFSVTGKWRASAVQLVLSGVNGRVRVFLNGIDEVNCLGEFEGWGSTCSVDIPSLMLDYNSHNTLYLEMLPATISQKKIFGWLWPEPGRITGRIELEAVSETTINAAETTVRYLAEKRQVVVTAFLDHHQSLKYGHWTVSGVIKDNGIPVAECVLPLDSNGEYRQQLNLVFDLPEAKLWSQEHPFLYQLDLKVSNQQGNTDQIQMPLGIPGHSATASAWTSGDRDFPVSALILGREEDYSIRNSRQMDSYLVSAKSKGYNVICFAGFFPDESWLYAADKIGMGVWLELPVAFVPAERMPQISEFESLFLLAGHHPSVLAWNCGKGLIPSAETANYLESIGRRLPGQAVYYLDFANFKEQARDDRLILIQSTGFAGNWGRAEYLQEERPTGDGSETIDDHMTLKVAAGCMMFWLMIVVIQNMRAPKLKYAELFNPNPKRRIRRAFGWRCLFLFTKYTLWAGLITSILFLPVEPPFWFPYDLSLLDAVQQQPAVAIWLFLTSALLLLRLFQVGLATTFFPQTPGTTALSCWLENRFFWTLLPGVSWVMIAHQLDFWYLPLLAYLVLSVFLISLRVRYVRRAGGKYLALALLPLTFLAVAVLAVIWHYPDLVYLYWLVQSHELEISLPQFQFTLPQINLDFLHRT